MTANAKANAPRPEPLPAADQRCDAVRPWLGRVADGECEPRRALAVAGHLRDCTSCRILLARERRLAQLLDSDLDDPLPAPDGFLEGVMQRLPEGPPPARKRLLGAVKGTLTAGWLAFLGIWAFKLLPVLGGQPGLPRIEAGDPLRLLESAGRVVVLAAVALRSLGNSLRWDTPSLGIVLPLLFFAALTLTLAAGGAAALVYALSAQRAGSSTPRAAARSASSSTVRPSRSAAAGRSPRIRSNVRRIW